MGKEIEFVIFVITCCIPFHCWVAPSLVEVEVVFAPSSERWSLVIWLRVYPSSVEVDCVCIASVEVVV